MGFTGGEPELMTGGGDAAVGPFRNDAVWPGLVVLLAGLSITGLITGSGGTLTTSTGVVFAVGGGGEVLTIGGGDGSDFGGAVARVTALVGCRAEFVFCGIWTTTFVGGGGANSISRA